MLRKQRSGALRVDAAATALTAILLAGAFASAEEVRPSSPAEVAGTAALAAAGPLLDRLKFAADEGEAMALEAQIWAAWSRSGDPDIDGLMERAGALMQVGRNEEALA